MLVATGIKLVIHGVKVCKNYSYIFCTSLQGGPLPVISGVMVPL